MVSILESGIVVFIIGVVILFILIIIFLKRFVRKVEPGNSLIIMGPGIKTKLHDSTSIKGIKVIFTWGLVFPFIQRAESMDISIKKMTVERKGIDGLICKDNIRADISANFYVRVNNESSDVITVAQTIGIERASTTDTLDDLFQAKFAEALKTVGKKMDFESLFQERDIFKQNIIEEIGTDLNGYTLEDTAIDYLEQTPVGKLDPENIMDAEGIRKIKEATLTKKEIVVKRETEATERILELEKQKAEAEAKQKAHISIAQSREEAEANKIAEEERLKSDAQRIETDRKLELASKNKERDVKAADERVKGATEIERLSQVKLIEDQKKSMADIISERVNKERAIAEEEEKTKDIRAFAEVERDKEVIRVKAETNAQEREVKAETERKTSIKISEAKQTLAKGIIEEESATGLAQVKVKEAEASAIKKVKLAEADGLREMSLAEAEGIKEKGLAGVKIKEADANAVKMMGEAKAFSHRAAYEAEAIGIEQKGLAEATMITKKAEAMKLLNESGKEHEEFKIKLAMEEKVAMEQLKIHKDIAGNHSTVVSAALKNANIDIVGGETEFFNKITQSISNGKSSSAFFENNKVLTELKDALLKSGDDNLIKRITSLLDEVGLSSEVIKNLSISALLTKLSASTKDQGILNKVFELKGMADKAGLGDVITGKLLGL